MTPASSATALHCEMETVLKLKPDAMPQIHPSNGRANGNYEGEKESRSFNIQSKTKEGNLSSQHSVVEINPFGKSGDPMKDSPAGNLPQIHHWMPSESYWRPVSMTWSYWGVCSGSWLTDNAWNIIVNRHMCEMKMGGVIVIQFSVQHSYRK